MPPLPPAISGQLRCQLLYLSRQLQTISPSCHLASVLLQFMVGTIIHVMVCLFSPAGAGSLPGWYTCTCPSTPAASGTPCVCPSTSAPGNLPTSSVPQFIVFTVSCHCSTAMLGDVHSMGCKVSLAAQPTAGAAALPPSQPPPIPCPAPSLQHDDSILQTTYNATTSALDGKKSANGCPVRAWQCARLGMLLHEATHTACSPAPACPLSLQAVATMFVTTLNTGKAGWSCRERGGWEKGGRGPAVLCDGPQPNAQPPAPFSCVADCSLARKLYAAGYEIADHTITHPHVSAQQLAQHVHLY